MTEEIKTKELSEEEADKAFSDDEEESNEALAEALEGLGDDEDEKEAEAEKADTADKIPDWVKMPPGLKLPPKGTKINYIRIPASMCYRPARGDQWCACWPITDLEESLAYGRARGDQFRVISEMSKQMIRVINGKKVDWTGKDLSASASTFWSTIGPKGRQIVRNVYAQTHQATGAELADFFENHFGTATVSGD